MPYKVQGVGEPPPAPLPVDDKSHDRHTAGMILIALVVGVLGSALILYYGSH